VSEFDDRTCDYAVFFQKISIAEPNQLHDQEKSPIQDGTLFLVAGAGQRFPRCARRFSARTCSKLRGSFCACPRSTDLFCFAKDGSRPAPQLKQGRAMTVKVIFRPW